MAFRIIPDECTACGLCADVCPSDSIQEGDDFYVIDPETCDECGACLDECPNEAIVEE
ncbi:MAG: 4Fe-4S binding protein [Firmicutes bacterium]|nr:4Fe-4S binding protein [Bacillota bacterium]